MNVESEDPCLTALSLERDVYRTLGSEAPPAGVRVRVHALRDRFRFELTYGDGAEARRELAELPADCNTRREAVSLALAMAIEYALAEERRTHEEPRPPTSPAAEAAEAGPTHTEPTVEPPPRRGFQLELLGGANVGILPGPAAEARLSGEVSFGPHWAVVAGGAFTSLSRASLAGGRLWARALWAALGLCAGGNTGRARLLGCLDVGLGAVLGRGHDLVENRRDTTASGTLDLGVRGRLALRAQLWLAWQAAAVVQWLRPRYEAVGEGTASPADVVGQVTFPPVGARFLLGLAWRAR